MKQRLRAFIGIDVSDSMTSILAELRQRPEFHSIKPEAWQHIADCHITLKFLGTTDRAIVDDLFAEIKQAATSFLPMQLSLQQLITLPSNSKPRYLAIKIAEQPDLIKLQQHIETISSDFGFAKENRTFLPHITIAKLEQYLTLPDIILKHTLLTGNVCCYESLSTSQSTHRYQQIKCLTVL